ncbi:MULTISPECIES: hypothetical protein [Streptomyces]|nr:hypothetical protein [Streptomyces sp. F8]MDX6759820.1 hypothetical protein [Streptomyces sp. F8]
MTVINVLTSCFFSTNQHRALGNDTTAPRNEQNHSRTPGHGTTD